MQYLGDTPLFERSHYVHQMKPDLPASVFARAPSRLAFIPAYATVAVLAIAAIARGWVPWLAVPVLSLVIGACFAGLTFVGHELLHGAIIGGKRTRHVLGWLTFLPFTLSPRLWTAWHNRVHHATTNFADDPDAYPTLERYGAAKGARFSVDAFALGGRRWRGVLSLVLGFTVQSLHQLVRARADGVLAPGERRRAVAETVAGAALWGAVALAIGIVPFLFAYVLPLAVANVIVMAFILTNHSLSPRVTIDDPLVSGLSVTTPRAIDWLTLGFGAHVEHHLFPRMSSRHAPAVRAAVLARWPERFQEMPLGAALGLLHRTARVYRDATTLIDPRTGATFATLMPRRPVRAREPSVSEPTYLSQAA
ncbi:MAG TPA: fatty acid desaturase [Kofleriaceae bacterium]|nr:fatty acid desaturase [Kofleriaceae bacterium]